MRDLKNPDVIKVKGALFLFLGLAAAGILLLEVGSMQVGVLLFISIWAFCRAYYFAFYVIEKYVDPSFRFSGLWAAVRYLVRRKLGNSRAEPD